MNRMPSFSHFGKNVRRERKRMGMTQLALAHAIGYKGPDAGAYISRAEAGRQQPRVRTLLKIAKALGTSLEDLLANG